MKLFKFLQRDKGLEEATLGLDRAYRRFMQEMWAFHLWWENDIRRDCRLQKLTQKEMQ